MNEMYGHLKRMMATAECVGLVSEVNMGVWLGTHNRISIDGKTADGRKFEMTLEVEKEAKQDA